MKTKLAICTIFFLLFVTACSGANAQPTATPVDVNALKTEVAATVVASISETAAAFIPPTEEATATITLTPTLSITNTPAVTVTPTENQCDKMVFISDVTVPDNEEKTPGQDFVKTWKVKNVGACEWKTNYIIVYGWGDPEGKMGGQNTALTANVLPGAEAEISITLKAPTPLGTYHGFWRLSNNNGYTFGTTLSIVIVVK